MQTTAPPKSLRALMSAAIDYAGLFPPATLPLEPALRNYAGYLRSPDAWMLGAFVLPVDQFGEADQHMSLFDHRHRLSISALGKRTATAAEFTETLASHARKIGDWSRSHADRAVIRQLEMPLPVDFDENLFVAMRSLIDPLHVQPFWEASAADAPRAIRSLAAHNATRPAEPFGFKLRTGGTAAEAFPDTAKVAVALVSAAGSQVPIKFTAGLHHPVRQFHDSVQTKMHGFLNVLGAGIFASQHQWNEEQTIRMLEDEDPRSFAFTDDGFVWRDQRISTDQIESHRAKVVSFGSCSFDEPRDDLRTLGLL